MLKRFTDDIMNKSTFIPIKGMFSPCGNSQNKQVNVR